MLGPSQLDRVRQPLARPLCLKKWVSLVAGERQLVSVKRGIDVDAMATMLRHGSDSMVEAGTQITGVAGDEAKRSPEGSGRLLSRGCQ